MFVRSILYLTLVLGVVTNASPGEKSRKYCDETHVRVTGRVRRIIGGTEAYENEFPHMVSLGYEKDGKIMWHCAGSLISNKYVLTAANCLMTMFYPKYVRFMDSQMDMMEIAKVISHPDYGHHYNDIGLLELEKPVEFNESIRPACLNTEISDDEKHTFIATGWGMQSYNQTQNSFGSPLMKVDLEEVSNDVCKKKYPSTNKFVDSISKESQICAGGLDKDTCFGDSGGPLQMLNPNYISTYDIHGITSFGKGCATIDGSVYTRVSHYIDWIESIVF